MPDPIHPLRAPVDHAHMLLKEVTERTDATPLERHAAEQALADACAALRGSDCPRSWELSEEGRVYTTCVATNAADALARVRNVDPEGYTHDKLRTVWVVVAAKCIETGESASELVTLHPPEPPCTGARGHDWRRPMKADDAAPGAKVHACPSCGLGSTRRDVNNPAGAPSEEIVYEPGKYARKP